MESLNETLSVGGDGDGLNESDVVTAAAATTESAFFIEPPEDPALAPCISFVLKSDIQVGKDMLA